MKINFNKVILLSILFLAICILPTFSKAAEFFCTDPNDDCYRHYTQWGYYEYRSIQGIQHAMRKDPVGWLTAPIPEDAYSISHGWNNEQDEFQQGLACIGHLKTDIATGELVQTIKRIVDVDENTTSEADLLLGYAAYKSTEAGEIDSDLPGKSQIRKWINDHVELTQYISNVLTEYATPEAKEYASSILNQKMTTTSTSSGANARQQITIKNGNTYIGPYNFTTVGGELTKAEVTTRDGTVYTTEYASTDGNSIVNIKDCSSYSGNDFYIVLQNQTVTSVSSIKVSKKFEVVKARIVITQNIKTEGQNVAVYYGMKIEDSAELILPGVPYSRITIKKVDKDTGNALAGVGLVLYSENQQGYLVQGTPCTFTSDIHQATEFMTTSSDLVIENIPQSGKYIVYETTSLVDQGYEPVSKDNPSKVGEFTISTSGQNVSITIENQKAYTNVKIIKTDANTQQELSGIGIVLYDVNEGKYVLQGTPLSYVSDINQATVYRTTTGGVEIDFIKIGHTYRIYEVVNPLFGYEQVSLQNPLYLTEFTATDNSTTATITATNKKEYIKLSGYVWEDKGENKNSTKDYLWNSGTYDQRVQYVTVRLKKSDGTTLATTTTDANGEYVFGNYDQDPNAIKIRIDDLVGAYVEFEYNGMGYESIRIDTRDNGNKATDSALRNAFNQNYAIISQGISADANGNKTYDINYNTSNYTSTVNYGSSAKYGYTGQTYPIADVDSQYSIQAITTKTSNNILYTSYTADSIRQSGVEEIENINLGVVEREMPDLAVTEDMEQVQISLNNYTHTYEYAQRFEDPEDYAGGDGFNVTVKFANKYLTNAYSREVYSSDVIYNQQAGTEGSLRIFVTYRIRVRNESTNLYTTARTLANYYDARYENVVVRDENGTIVQSSTDSSYNVNGLRRLDIQLDQRIDHGETKEFTITYQLNNDAINSILNGNVTLDSLTEVTSYSTYSDNGYSVAYAGIDIDSAPDNVTPTDTNTFEDDTDRAPSLILQVREGRIIQGKVWEDSAIQELLERSGYSKERKGNGIYETTENVVNNVKVDLMAIGETGDLTVAKLYQANNTVVDATTTTSGQGDYRFLGVVPGNYILRYTYGDNSVIVDAEGNILKNVDVDNYKSTIYRGGDETAVNAMTDYWYAHETGASAQRLSDAKDNDAFINDRITEDEINYATATQSTSLTEISADTRRFEIRLDYDINDINLEDISQYENNLVWVYDNIDFGIIERPRQSLIVDKQIANVQIALANGTSIINGDPRSQNLSGVKLLDDDVYIEIDNEIIQGATLKVTYEITVDNSNCEIDYNNEDYYIYGTVPAGNADWKIATVVDMFDYLPEEVVLESTENNNWERIYITEDMKGTFLSEEVYDTVKGFQNIIHLKNPIFENMVPGSEAIDTSMVVSRQLSTTTDDLTYENDIEIIQLRGRKTVDSIPGNYDPTTNTPNEPDDDDVEVTITGPTGENRQYIIYGIIGISTLVIIGVGIVIIKKRVLKK